MNSLRLWLYERVPKKWRKRLGKSKFLKPIRDVFFRKTDTYREVMTRVVRGYEYYIVEFDFFTSIQIASKATSKGMENTLLRNSIQLLKNHFPNRNDDYTILDVGANFGYLSLVWAHSIGKNGTVYSFEPHPHIYKSLTKSVVKNNRSKTIIPENLAVGSEQGKISLQLSNVTSNTLEEVAKKNKAFTTTEIEMVTLDHYFTNTKSTECHLVKIDVDGIELDILKGAKELIKKHRPIFIVEANEDYQIIHFFESLQYTLLDMNLAEYQKNKPLPPNLFCVPKHV